ncbi:MAG: hypothetical protein RJQ04_17490, partial [Longimicrobiales bacterium]
MRAPRSGRVRLGTLLVLAGSACTPQIESLQVEAGEPGERLRVTATIDRNGARVTPVVVAVGAAAQPLAPTGGSRWEGRTPRLPPGHYQARLSVSYRRLLPPSVDTLSAERDFTLAWPDGTFTFERENEGLDGWTFDGVYEAGTAIDVTACDPRDPVLLARSPSGWPLATDVTDPDPPNGSLRVVLDMTCFPGSPSVTSSLWQFDLISPDLSDRPEWQDIEGVAFRMVSAGVDVRAPPTRRHRPDAATPHTESGPAPDTGLGPDR